MLGSQFVQISAKKKHFPKNTGISRALKERTTTEIANRRLASVLLMQSKLTFLSVTYLAQHNSKKKKMSFDFCVSNSLLLYLA